MLYFKFLFGCDVKCFTEFRFLICDVDYFGDVWDLFVASHCFKNIGCFL